jgi:hypothetical protein
LQFAADADNTIWTSTNGGGQVVGWFGRRLFEKTGDAQKAQSRGPFSVHTNGNGKRDEAFKEEVQWEFE